MKTKTTPAPDKTAIENKKYPELKTDPPLSEKDEVKQAEVRTDKASKKSF